MRIEGNADKEEEEFVDSDVVDIIVDVGRMKVDEVEETGTAKEKPAFG